MLDFMIGYNITDTYDAAAPTCDLVSCGTAPVYADMTADQSGPLDYPQSVTYTCSPGYYKSTTENVVCSATGKPLLNATST